jgi:hypothetical protein
MLLFFYLALKLGLEFLLMVLNFILLLLLIQIDVVEAGENIDEMPNSFEKLSLIKG